MSKEFAALYCFTAGARDIERAASCVHLLDAVVLYYLNPKACYIVYQRKKYREQDIARVAYGNKEVLRELLGDSRVYGRIEASISKYIADFV